MLERREDVGMKRSSMTRMAVGSVAVALFGAACSSGEAVAPQDTPSAVSTIVIPRELESIASEQTEANKKYPQHEVIATIYWIGEEATAANDYISNVGSAWDSDAVGRFGGVDGLLRNFIPMHNTFYFALPAGEFDEKGLITGAREASPWTKEMGALTEAQSLFKGRWAKVTADGHSIYAQWHDVGPNEEQDYGYVFGQDKPDNRFGLKAGIDLSPDAAKALRFADGGKSVSWQFVDAAEVPDGPWKRFAPIDNQTYWE